MNKTVALGLAIVVILVSGYLTRVSNEILEDIVVLKMEETIISDPFVNDVLLVDLMMPSIKEILDENVRVRDIFFYKVIDVNGIITGKYVSVFGRLFEYSDTEMDISLFSIWYENNTGNNPKKLTDESYYSFGEFFTSVPVSDGSNEIVSLEIGLVYTDDNFADIITSKSEEIDSYVKSYFANETFESLIDKDSLTRMSEEILADLIDIYDTDQINFTRVIISNFDIK